MVPINIDGDTRRLMLHGSSRLSSHRGEGRDTDYIGCLDDGVEAEYECVNIRINRRTLSRNP